MDKDMESGGEQSLPARASASLPVNLAVAPRIDKSLDLASEEEKVGDVDPKGKAIVFGIYTDTLLRAAMVLVMALIFIVLNWRVLGFISDAFSVDVRMLEATPPRLAATDRLVTSNVLMSLIGATVIQVGVSITAIVSYLFPKGVDRNA